MLLTEMFENQGLYGAWDNKSIGVLNVEILM